MHGETLTNVANAIKGRDDPETVPDVQGMDGIPAADLAEFTARMTGQPPAISSVGIRAPRPWNAPPITQSSQQPATKRAKIDAPLDSQTIAAQLAEFQAKKEQEELAQFIATGVAYPPGTRSQSAFFIIRSNPPGQGAWTAKGWSQLYPGSELPKPSPPRPWPRDADGKSAHSSSINSSAQLSTPANESLSSPKISAAKCVSSPTCGILGMLMRGLDLHRRRVFALQRRMLFCRFRLRHQAHSLLVKNRLRNNSHCRDKLWVLMLEPRHGRMPVGAGGW